MRKTEFLRNRLTQGVLLLMVVLGLSGMANAAEPEPDHAAVKTTADGGWVIWHEVQKEWLDPEAFWLAYAESQGGLTWGRTDTYPPYRQVSEHDLILIEVASGPCLMEFFHRRWRRAQDVRRWDPRFNEFGGCPNVFK